MCRNIFYSISSDLPVPATKYDSGVLVKQSHINTLKSQIDVRVDSQISIGFTIIQSIQFRKGISDK